MDDGLRTCKETTRLSNMISHLKDEFEITTGLAEVYIGLCITKDRPQQTIYMDKARYIETMLA